jgi:hypothetical protein
MPRRLLTEKQRAEALQQWWATFPYGSNAQRLEAISKFEQQYGPLTEAEKRSAMFRWSPEDKARVGISSWHMAPTDIGEQAALGLCEQLLDDSHYDLLLNQTGLVETPDFEPLCILLKNCIPQELINAVRPVVRKAAHRKVAAGNRGVAAGTGMQPRRRKDGTVGSIKGIPILEDLSEEDYKRIGGAKDGTFGFLDRTIGGGQVYPCRLTRYGGALPAELRLMSELASAVAESFRRSFVSDRWESQFAKATNTPLTWLIRTKDGHTPFTTITCNKSFRTAAHIDAGDLKEGFGVMCSMGDFEGCDLVFPRYRTAVRYREGDVLLANVHQVHGNTPLLTPEGKEPKLGREPERLVCVFYYREKMDQCESTIEKEHEFINKREKGDAMRKGKAKAKAAGKK